MQMNNIELIFLPPNTTSVAQPMDAGVIKNFKFHYRNILANRKLETSEGAVPFSWNILDAIIALKSAWNKVKPVTVANCYSKAGFVEGQEDSDDDAVDDGDDDAAVASYRNFWHKLFEVYGDDVCAMDEYVGVDETAQTSATLSDDQIIESVRHPDTDGDMSEGDEAPVP